MKSKSTVKCMKQNMDFKCLGTIKGFCKTIMPPHNLFLKVLYPYMSNDKSSGKTAILS